MGATLVVGIAFGLLWAYFGRRLAIRKGRSATIWPIVCFLTGLIGLIVLAIVPATAAKKAEAARPAQAPPAPVPDTVPLAWVEEMRHIGELHDAGTLSDDEFAHEKERLLAQH
jgi:hypothetical protein